MDQTLVRKDPLAKGKKTGLTVFVVVVGGLAILGFLIFGRLLRDFLIFDANRTQAANELNDLQSQIKEQADQRIIRKVDLESQLAKGKEQVQRLEETIAKREALISSQQNLVDDCAVLSEKRASAKKDYQVLLDELKIANERVAVEKGAVSELKSENSALTTQKVSLQVELIALAKAKDTSEKAVAQLDAQVAAFKQEKSATQTEATEVRKALADVSTSLTNQNIKVASMRRAISQLEEESSRVKVTYDSLSAQVTLAKETVKFKLAEKEELETTLVDLTQKKRDLSAAITALEERKRNADAQTKAAEAKAEHANTRLHDVVKAAEAPTNQASAANESPMTTNPNKN